ncbi:MAG: glycerate kinase [Planctomycetota bacterium]
MSAVKIVLAPNGFKQCLDAVAVCAALAEGVALALPEAEVVELPLADGGEGTTRALVAAAGGRLERRRVTGPLGEAIDAELGVLPDGRGVVEVAAASGFQLVPPARRDPRRTTSYGTGELMRAAHELGCPELIVGLGGSATNDAGAGIAQALGVRLLDAAGQELERGGAALARLARIEAAGALAGSLRVTIACDVDNPLTGPRGASRTYGPQKGATPAAVEELDAALATFAAVAARDLGRDVAEVPGAGAAGGIGAGLLACTQARLVRGADLVLDAVRFDERVRGADLVITGEGQLDEQTLFRKLPLVVAQRARAAGVPTVALAGRVDPSARAALHAAGFAGLCGIASEPLALERSLAEAPRLLRETGETLARLWAAARDSGH